MILIVNNRKDMIDAIIKRNIDITIKEIDLMSDRELEILLEENGGLDLYETLS